MIDNEKIFKPHDPEIAGISQIALESEEKSSQNEKRRRVTLNADENDTSSPEHLLDL